MPLPWLQIIDAALGVANFARGRRAPAAPAASSEQLQLDAGGRGSASLEARLGGVVVAALKEAFDRDSRRLELEREQLEAERQRAERALQLELQRLAGDREIGRLRLLAGVAVASCIGTLLLVTRLAGGAGGGIGTRVAIGGGWLLLLAAVAASFMAQSRVAAALGSDGETSSGLSGALTLWLIVCGLILVGLAVFIGA
jgi:hypothetical protein